MAPIEKVAGVLQAYLFVSLRSQCIEFGMRFETGWPEEDWASFPALMSPMGHALNFIRSGLGKDAG